MSRWKKIVLAILLVPVLAAAAVFAIPSMRTKVMGYLRGEVFFAGQPASAWADDLAAEVEGGKKGPVFDQLKAGGKAAIPVLMELGTHPDPKLQQHARLLLVQVGDAAVAPMSRALTKKGAADRKMAVLVLGELGGKAKGTAKNIAELINDNDAEVRAAVMTALGNIGPDAVDAVPALVELLEGKDKNRALEAAVVIAKIGPRAKDAVPALIKNIEMDHAAYGPFNAALTSIGEPSVPPLIVILESDKAPAIRSRAAQVCQLLGGKAKAAVPALGKSLHENAANLNKEACRALQALGVDALPAAPALIAAARDPASPIRGPAVQALGQIGPQAKGAVAALIDILKEPKKTAVFNDVKVALGKMGPAAHPAVSILLATFGSDAPIKQIGPVAIPDLVLLLPGPKGEVNPHARHFLESFKKEDVVPHLLKHTVDENADMRRAVITLLGPKSADAKEDVMYTLLFTLHDGDETIRAAARTNLQAFGKSAQSYLEQIIRGKDLALRIEALQLLGDIGPAAKSHQAGVLLVSVLQDKEKKSALDDIDLAKGDIEKAKADLEKAKTDKDAAALKKSQEALDKAQAALKIAEFYLTQANELEWLTVRTLALMQYHPKESKSVLLDALANKKDLEFTVVQIGLQGEHAAEEAIPILDEVAKDKDAKLRVAAIQAIAHMKVGERDLDKLPASLIAALQDADPAVRAAAALAFGTPTRPGKYKALILTPLLECLKAAEPEVQRAAIVTLGKMEKDARDAAPALIKVIEENPMLLDVGVVALGRIEADARDKALSTKLLLGLLEKKASNVADVIDALGLIRAPDLVKVLEPMMKKENGAVGVAAALALWRESDKAIPFLLDQTKDKSVAARAVAALGAIPKKTIGAKGEEQLLSVLETNADVRVRAAAAVALGRLRPELLTDRILRALSGALRSPDRNLRICAAEALGQYRAEAMPFRGSLDPLLDDMESHEVRDSAKVAADRIGE